MPVVSEMVHPKGFDFATQRQIVLLREVRKLKWEDIAKQVKNLQGENPLPRLCANYYHEFSRRLGRRRARYDRCGNKPSKVTPQVEQFLVKQLKVLRRTCVCTSTTLQQVLAQDMGSSSQTDTCASSCKRKATGGCQGVKRGCTPRSRKQNA